MTHSILRQHPTPLVTLFCSWSKFILISGKRRRISLPHSSTRRSCCSWLPNFLSFTETSSIRWACSAIHTESPSNFRGVDHRDQKANKDMIARACWLYAHLNKNSSGTLADAALRSSSPQPTCERSHSMESLNTALAIIASCLAIIGTLLGIRLTLLQFRSHSSSVPKQPSSPPSPVQSPGASPAPSHQFTLQELKKIKKASLSQMNAAASGERGARERGGSPCPRLNAEAAGAGSALNRTRQKRIGRCIPHAD